VVCTCGLSCLHARLHAPAEALPSPCAGLAAGHALGCATNGCGLCHKWLWVVPQMAVGCAANGCGLCHKWLWVVRHGLCYGPHHTLLALDCWPWTVPWITPHAVSHGLRLCLSGRVVCCALVLAVKLDTHLLLYCTLIDLGAWVLLRSGLGPRDGRALGARSDHPHQHLPPH